ncbi:uncharacterized protein PG998_013149 [Apiospora kogelbergensis]|uniref:uncharacterized protein n=1 Tax=Apiospora kogelbergensis TaxID=1337665 RepID=UPI00312DCA40
MPAAIAAANTTKTGSSGSPKGLWSTIKRAAKEHHQSVNAAYSTFYGMGTAGITSQNSSRASSAAASPVHSQAASPHASPRSSAEHKKRVRAQHESLNASVWGLYGASNAR